MALHYAVAAVPAIQLSLILTFSLNEAWTWQDRRPGWIVDRFLKYQMVNGIGIGLNLSALMIFTSLLDIHYLFSNFIGASIAAFWNFFGNHFITWNDRFLFLRRRVSLKSTPPGKSGRCN